MYVSWIVYFSDVFMNRILIVEIFNIIMVIEVLGGKFEW